MTTLAKYPSDSEDDEDYIPPLDANDSDSSSNQRQIKKPKLGSTEAEETTTPKNITRDALWAEFQSSVSQREQGPSTPARREQDKRTVTIKVARRFAGETVLQDKVVPEDSEEARKWLTSQGANHEMPSAVTTTVQPSDLNTPVSTSTDASPVSQSDSKAVETTSAAPRPKPMRPPKKSLASMAAAAKPKKMTVLEKSKMDWNSHLANVSSEEQDEIEKNRRGGGYLEKVDFLKRVDDRREDARDALKRRR